MMDKMQKDLEAVGFQEKEAKVYLASLELGAATAQQIALKAGVKRPTTYFILEGLMGQGLATSFHQGKKQFFIAEAPDRLLELLDQERKEITVREEKFRSILPQLHSINNRQKDKPVVKYYEGKEGILTMVSEHTKSSRGQEVYTAFSRDIVNSFVSANELENIGKERMAHDVKVKALYTWKDGNLKEDANKKLLKTTELEFPISCDIALYEDKVRIASLKDRLVGVVIEDKEIAKSFRAIYALAWKWIEHQQGKR
jgi:sugar-specific transcriptional regulator TrmB